MAEGSDSDRTIVIGATGPEPASSRLHQNALPVGSMLGEFEIVDLVGEGGFGIVYLAQDHSLQRKVALKEYMPALLASRGHDAAVSVRSERQRETFEAGLRSFVNEARMLAQFDHPALVKVYRFWEANGTAYMVMPYYSGRTLQEALKLRGEPPGEAWIRAILSPIMDALGVLHEDRVYHRDISPDNIMLLAGDRPVLLDFGAARRVISDMTHALTVILKPGYAPIEQYADMPGMKQGPWTDVYALAAVVYFMILGRKPPAAVTRLMQDEYQPLTRSEAAGRYSAQLLEGLDRCLSVRAQERPQSIEAMREALGSAAMPAAAAVAPTVVQAPAAPQPPVAVQPAAVAQPPAAAQSPPPVQPPAPASSTLPQAPVQLQPPTPRPASASLEATVVQQAPVPPRAPAVPRPAPAPEARVASLEAPTVHTAPAPTAAEAVAAAPPRALDTSMRVAGRTASAPATKGKVPLLVGGALVLAVIAAGTAYVLTRPSAPTAPTVAAKAPAPSVADSARPAAPTVPAAPAAPPVTPIASLAAAIDAAVSAADPRLSVTLEAPARIAAGGDLKLVLRSKSDGLLYVFVWDQATDRVHRLMPDRKDGGNAIKADGSLTLTHKEPAGSAAEAATGGLRVVSMLSEKPRDLAATAFGGGEGTIADRSAVEARLAANGLAGLFGTPQCAAGESCPDHFAIGAATVARDPAPPAARARTAKTASPNAQAPASPGKKAPDSEREYMKRLDKDLDKLLGK